MDLKNMNTEELEKLIEEANKELSRREKTLVVYVHDCKNDSDYHLNKYKHWSKRVLSVDTTKTNEHAFRGEFLNVRSEHELPIGTIVVEACGDNIRAYKLTSSGKERFAEAKRKSMSDFIDKVAEEVLFAQVQKDGGETIKT